MLQTQVEYWKLEETKRHNRATEGQANEQIAQGWQTIAETSRHNVVSEALGYANFGESQRHNIASESELNRHNMAQEQLGFDTLGENVRHNRAAEAETQRHNTVSESQNWSSINEQARHNAATEQLTSRQIAESARHNKVAESQGWSNLAETKRSHQVNEQIQKVQTIEQQRHNLETETNQAIQARAAETNANTNFLNYSLAAGTTPEKVKIDAKNADTAAKKQQTEAAQGWVRTIAEPISDVLNLGVKVKSNKFSVDKVKTSVPRK